MIMVFGAAFAGGAVGAASVNIIIKAVDQFSGVIDKATSNFGILGNIAGGAFKAVSAGATVAVGALTAFGASSLKSASDFEQSRVAFETMLGSAEKAKSLLADISKFAQKTPFELPDVVEGSKRLLAFGVEQKKIIPTLKSLGDVAAGLGVPMERLILNFGQVRNQGKLTGRELRDFNIAGVPIIAELSKNLNVSERAIAGMVEEGKIGFADVEEAFRTMSGEGGRFFDLMTKQSQTVGGIISNLKDIFGKLGRSIVGISEEGEIEKGSIFEIFKQGLYGFLGLLEQTRPVLESFFKGAVSFIKDVGIAIFKNFDFEPIKAMFVSFADVIMRNLPTIKQIFISVGNTLASMFNFLADIYRIIVDLGLLDILLVGFGGLAKILEVVSKALEIVTKAVSNLINKISQSAFGKAIGAIFETMGKTAFSILDFVSGKLKVGDFILTADGKLLQTDPRDTIIGTKNPESVGGTHINITIGTIQGLNPNAVAEALQRRLQTMISV